MSSTTARLRDAGRTPPTDITLALAGGKSLQVHRWLRVLPGKRLVGYGEWDGKKVLAKLFIATGAERHWQRESVGIQALQQAGISTPALLDSGDLPGGGYYLLTEYLADAQSLQQCWEQLTDQSPHNPQAFAVLQGALQIIAVMHAKGLLQADLHLGNFLQDGQQLYVIDGDAIEAQHSGKPLPLAAVRSNLSLFFAQLMPQWESQLEALLRVYLDCNAITGLQSRALTAEIKAQRQRRLDDFLGKTLRDCSQFAVTKSGDRFCAVLRSEQDALASVLADPDSLFGSVPLLKDGGSSTVTRANVAGRELVIKRYNIKGIGHWLTRFWRPSRAWHSWLAAWRLSFLGIATPQPLAMIERRIGPLRREAWLVTDYCPGESLFERLGQTGEALPDQATADAILRIFNQLNDAWISHGDFKASNLLWQEGQVWLIDLDAMQSHANEASWRKGWAKDRARFVRNWPADSPLAQWLEQSLPH
ncbi:lipopolysaccharide kinase InaA family protein [Halopseudomonas sp. SMJS2]|uniref:lipopolysaccharide kinase InaA family protein n=1 Tax=Halopseudomonas sp. SMJS2 TaxID=3041098 RepID=UPI00245342D6|nr:lipopolysaccharide kinase InaA family protein [Halopseudomonas sp. SMJS2]WGK62540.1 lipopolysaccharide kinase InaA family protein [Halopseudomonas sp. SMJS2]